jgi:hypothetical protein
LPLPCASRTLMQIMRAALRRVFEAVTLVRADDGLVLIPKVREFEEVGGWLALGPGRDLVQPLPNRMAVPKQLVREGSCSHPLFASALFEPIPLG